MTLRVSTPAKEGVYQGSKWLKFQLLCSAEELGALFAILHPFFIFPLTGIVDGKPLSEKKFLNEYSSWIADLQNGRIPSDQALRTILAAAFTDDLDTLWLQEIPQKAAIHESDLVQTPAKGYLVKISKPIVQVQAHYFSYSTIDGVFRPMSMGKESIFWGLQFSYPQIYQDAKTMELKTAENNTLFEKIRLWVRDATRATPFSVAGVRINSPRS